MLRFLIPFLFLVLLGVNVWLFINPLQSQEGTRTVVGVAVFLLAMLVPPGFLIVQPNQAKVLIRFGRY
jgi:hypothetical protein